MSGSTSAVGPSSPDKAQTVKYNEKLSCKLATSYGLFRLPISGFDFAVRPARTNVYIEALNHNMLTHAMTVSCCKAVDLLLGFIVGNASDNTSTRWGRRKPWIVVCFPIAIVAMFLLVWPFPYASGATSAFNPKDAPCGAIAADVTSKDRCPALQACIAEMVGNGTLPAWDEAPGSWMVKHAEIGRDWNATVAERREAPAGLSVWFAVFYFSYYFFSWTCTMITYDALGMELTSDYNSRVTLFSMKAVFQFIGYVLPALIGYVLLWYFPNDIVAVYAYTAVMLGIVSVIVLIILVLFVHERPESYSGEGNNVPFVVAINRALENKPYRMYLLIKFPLSLASLLPLNFFPYFLRYAMVMENWAPDYFLLQIVILFASVMFIGPIWWLARRFGKRTVVLVTCAGASVISILFFFVEPATLPMWLMYVFGLFVGFAAVVTFVVMDSMLADVIDYEMLNSGKRAEGVYTVAETNFQQFVEIIGGVVPLLIMNALGFENNGGCACGCGVACDAEYLRWSCPNDVAYSCDGSYESDPFFGDVDRSAPCVQQSSDGVVWMIRIFLFGVLGVLFLVAVAGAYWYPLTQQKHQDIIAATEKIAAGGTADDPFTGEPVVRKSDTPEGLKLEHFSKKELESLGTLVGRVGTRMAIWGGAILALVVAMASTQGDVQQYVVSLGAIICAALFILLPWDALRFNVAREITKNGESSTQIISGAPASPGVSGHGPESVSL